MAPSPLRGSLVALCLALVLTFLSAGAPTPLPSSLLVVAAAEVRLTTGAEDIEANFPARTAAATDAHDANAAATGYPTRSLVPLRASCIPEAATLMGQAATAFKATKKSFDVRFDNAVSSPEIKTRFLNQGGYDFAVMTAGPVAADYVAMPSVIHYPLQANAIVFTYNLPTALSGGNVLALRPTTLCQIFRGNITRWNDTAIRTDNPAMTGLATAAADQPIVIPTVSVQTATHYWFSTYCGKIDPIFKTLVPAAVVPAYPVNKVPYNSLDLMNSAVADTVYSLAITTWSNAADIYLPVGAFINSKGKTILPNTNSMSLTLYELATDGYTFQDSSWDLNNPTTAQAWPILTMSFLYVDRSNAISTCANKKMLQDFLLFLYTSDVVSSLASSLATMMLPSVFVEQLRILQRIQTELTCLEEPLFSSSASKGFIPTTGLGLTTMKLFSSFYLSVDPAIVFTSEYRGHTLAVQRTIMGEANLAVVNAAGLGDDDVALLDEGRTKLTPAFLAGVVPTFTLPYALTAFAALPTTKDLGLPALYPLLIDLELTTRIFIGDMTSWLDDGLVKLNPQLPAWFTASGAPTLVQIVVGATSPTDPLSGAKLLFQRMAYSQTAQLNPWAFVPSASETGPGSNPFLAIVARSAQEAARANFTLIDSEYRLTIKVGTISGAISYRPMNARADPRVEFQWAEPDGVGGYTVVSSAVSSLKNCATQLTKPTGFATWSESKINAHMELLSAPDTQREWVNAINPKEGCWPLTTLLSFVAKTVYSTAVQPTACSRGLHSLEFINYISSTDILSLPAESFGLVRLGEFPAIAELAHRTLQSAICDGSALLVIPPVYWSVTPPVSAFGQAMAAIGLVLIIGSLAITLFYRHKVVIRSSSVPFLCAILVGMALLLAAMIPWSVVPSASSCSSFLWLVNLGFMLLFCPLFAKTWRVYRIFSGSHLKVVKISNIKLLAGTAAIIALDVILIGVWQGVSPLVPVQYDRLLGSEQHVFTHCSVESSGSGFVFVALVGTEKTALLLFGAVMAFSTRNVKGTFNESAAISWTIYNTLMSAFIGVAIIVFVSAVEDALVLLVLILLTWIVLSAWALIFVPKFHLLMQSDEKVIEASRSQITQEKSNGFSFASIAAMTTGQIKQFYVALKLQVNKAERVLQLPMTVFNTGGINITTDHPAGSAALKATAQFSSRGISGGGGGGSRLSAGGVGIGVGGAGKEHHDEDSVTELQQLQREAAYMTEMRMPLKDRDGLRERGMLSQKPSLSTQPPSYRQQSSAAMTAAGQTGPIRLAYHSSATPQSRPSMAFGGESTANGSMRNIHAAASAAGTPTAAGSDASELKMPSSAPAPRRTLGVSHLTVRTSGMGESSSPIPTSQPHSPSNAAGASVEVVAAAGSAPSSAVPNRSNTSSVSPRANHNNNHVNGAKSGNSSPVAAAVSLGSGPMILVRSVSEPAADSPVVSSIPSAAVAPISPTPSRPAKPSSRAVIPTGSTDPQQQQQ